MAELAQAADVYAPKTLQVWRTLLNWLAFFFQIFVQIIKGTPSVTQVLSFVGLRHTSFLSPPSPQFKPLPVVELQESEEAPPPPPPPSSSVQISPGNVSDDQLVQKLTVSNVLTVEEFLVASRLTSCLNIFFLLLLIGCDLCWFHLVNLFLNFWELLLFDDDSTSGL